MRDCVACIVDSVVGVVTRHDLDEPGFESRQKQILIHKMLRTVLGPTHTTIHWVPASHPPPGMTRLRRNVDHTSL